MDSIIVFFYGRRKYIRSRVAADGKMTRMLEFGPYMAHTGEFQNHMWLVGIVYIASTIKWTPT